MATKRQTLREKTFCAVLDEEENSHSRIVSEAALIERLPFALTYAANLEPRDHAILFYDNLVVAAEYFCAFIQEGIRRQQVTCFTGLEPTRYRSLFEQVGIKVAELENSGYLRNLSNSAYNELEGLGDNPAGIRFVHLQKSTTGQSGSIQELLENERRTHKLYSIPTTSICCYDAKLVLEDTPSGFFKQLLKVHDHCLFQGIAMPTSRLLDLQRDSVFPSIRTP